MSKESMSIIEADDVCKSYRRGGLFGSKERFEVLKNINLTVEPGACLGLLGRSGSGKSTLSRILLDLEAPDSGDVLFMGKSIKTLNGDDYVFFRRNAQVVFQNALGSVNPRFTAEKIIAEPLLNFEDFASVELKRKIGGLLEQVGLRPDDAVKYPHQFSGGELQRVCIARAIALKPRLIVLDEAVSSLDMLVQARIVDLLSDLQKELGVAYLFISHDVRVLLKMADKLAVMDDGRIVEQVECMDDADQITHPAFTGLCEAILPPAPDVFSGREA